MVSKNILIAAIEAAKAAQEANEVSAIAAQRAANILKAAKLEEAKAAEANTAAQAAREAAGTAISNAADDGAEPDKIAELVSARREAAAAAVTAAREERKAFFARRFREADAGFAGQASRHAEEADEKTRKLLHLLIAEAFAHPGQDFMKKEIIYVRTTFTAGQGRIEAEELKEFCQDRQVCLVFFNKGHLYAIRKDEDSYEIFVSESQAKRRDSGKGVINVRIGEKDAPDATYVVLAEPER